MKNTNQNVAVIICSAVIIICAYLLNTKGNYVEVTELEVASMKKQWINAKGDKPDEFQKYFSSITTKYNQTAPGYKSNYRLVELNKAISNTSSVARMLAPVFVAKSRGPGNVAGRTRAIVVDPTDNTNQTWFAGASSGGIWKTSDQGESWENLTPELPNLSTNALAISASNPDVLYAGTGEIYADNLSFVRGNGIFKSVDHGVTWTQLESTSSNINFLSVNRIIIDPSSENALFVATNSGVYKSNDGGSTWVEKLDAGERVQDLDADPNNFSILYASVNSRGVYKSVDGGESWKLMADGMGEVARLELAISPENTNKVYALTYDQNDKTLVYRTTDGGTTWELFDDPNNNNIDYVLEQGWYDLALAVNPYNEDEVFIGGVTLGKYHFNGTQVAGDPSFLGVQLFGADFLDFVNFSQNFFGGALAIGDGSDPADQFNTVEIRFGPGLSQKAHRFTVPSDAGTNGDGGAGISDEEYSYSDYVDVPFEVWDIDGDRQLMISFRDQQNDGGFNLNHRDDSNDPDLLTAREYLFIHDIDYAETQSGLVSIPGGHMAKNMYFFWPLASEEGSWDEENLPSSTMIIKFGSLTVKNGVAESVSDSRGDFGSKNAGLHADHHHLTIIPVNDEGEVFSIINGNDGGLGFSQDNGETWKQIANGYITTQFYGADKMPGSDKYIGGMQDNGTWMTNGDESADATSEYKFSIGGDGFEVLWHSTDPLKLMGGYYNNNFFRSLDGGVTWVAAQNGINTEEGPFISRLASSSSNSDIVFAVGASGVYKTLDFGDRWKLNSLAPEDGWTFAIDNVPTITSQHDVEVSVADDKVVWAGGGMDDVRKIFVSTDRGDSFTPVNNPEGFDLGGISGIATHPSDPNTAYILFSFAETAKIFRTTDLGDTWSDISGFGTGTSSSNGFPDVIVHSLLVSPFDENMLLAGTEIGLFVSYDNGDSWALSDFGLPSVSIWSLKVVDDQIVVGTHGRGIWTLTNQSLLNHQALVIDGEYLGNKQVELQFKLPVAYDKIDVIVDEVKVITLNDLNSELTYNSEVDLYLYTATVVPTVEKNLDVKVRTFLGVNEYLSSGSLISVNFSPKILSLATNSENISIVDVELELKEKYSKLDFYINDVKVKTITENDIGTNVFDIQLESAGKKIVKVVGELDGIALESFEKSITVSAITSVNAEPISGIQIWPNPTSSVLNVKWEEFGVYQRTTWEVVDIRGRSLIKENTGNYDEGLKIDVSYLPRGIYLIKVQHGSKKTISKFIVN